MLTLKYVIFIELLSYLLCIYTILFAIGIKRMLLSKVTYSELQMQLITGRGWRLVQDGYR